MFVVSLILMMAAVSPAGAQTAPVAVEENVRAEPEGTIIGELHPGALVEVLSTEGDWSRITFGGMVWIPSLQVRHEGAWDLIVSADDGENLRSEPSGPIIGRLGSGTLLEEVRRIPGWVEVRRTAWIWRESLGSAVDSAEDAGGGELPAEDAMGTGAPRQEGPPGTGAPSPTEPGSEWIRAPAGGAAILAGPDGDTLASTLAGSELRILQREGSWVRVRLEGWVWAPDAADTDEGEPTEAVIRGLSVAELTAEPERYRGRVVELEVQFISLERAEAVRADFREGEPFLLTRSADRNREFIYIAIPPSEVEEAGRMTPLDRLTVIGRVRTGAAALTGNPVLDLLEWQLHR